MAPRIIGLSPLEDQQLGGLSCGLAAGLYFLLARGVRLLRCGPAARKRPIVDRSGAALSASDAAGSQTPIIAGFVAIGSSTAALMIAYVIANGAADSQGDFLRQWFWQLTHNEVVTFSRAAPAIAIGLHVILGMHLGAGLRALLRAADVGAGLAAGHAVLAPAVALLAADPAARGDVRSCSDVAFSAGPLPPLGNLVLHLIYGFTLGQLYDSSADEPALAEDTAYDEPLERAAVEHSEEFGAAGILVGAVVGAAVGVGLAVVLPPTLPNIDFQGWSVALAVGGILAGGAVGGIVGSFAGLPSTPDDPAEVARGRRTPSIATCCRSCCRRS